MGRPEWEMGVADASAFRRALTSAIAATIAATSSGVGFPLI